MCRLFRSFILVLSLCCTAEATSGQQKFLTGHIQYLNHDPDFYNGPMVEVNIMKDDSVIATSFADSTGIFPLAILGENERKNKILLDSIRYKMSKYVYLKPVPPGEYTILLKHGSMGRVYKNVVLDYRLNSLKLDFSYGYQPCDDPECPIGHKNGIVPVGGNADKALRGEIYLKGCFPMEEKWFCKKHGILF